MKRAGRFVAFLLLLAAVVWLLAEAFGGLMSP